MKFVVSKSIFNILDAETIEKAKKGEQVGGDYLFREYLGEKTTKEGTVSKYRYYRVTDMLKDSAETILSKLKKQFFSKNPDQAKKIDESYDKLNIKKDFKADKKTYFQHICEYFSHRAIWDKRFADKANQKKHEKPVIMEASDQIEDEEMDSPAEQVPVIKEKEPKQKKEPKENKPWKPNPSLMYRIWQQNTGKTEKKEEKTVELANEKLNQVQESEAEKHENRSEAMLGNKNAEKDGVDLDKLADSQFRNVSNSIMLIEQQYKLDKTENASNDEKIKSLKKLKARVKKNQKDHEKHIEELKNFTAWTGKPGEEYGYINGEIISKKDAEAQIKKFENPSKNEVDWNGETVKYIDSEIEKLKEVENGKDNSNIEQGGISGSDKDLREPVSTDSNENVSEPGNGDNTTELLHDTLEPRVGPKESETIDLGIINRNNGRLTKSQALKIREACKKLLASKTDAEMTEADKALLSQYVGAGGLNEEGATNSGTLYEFYTPRPVIKKCWELLDKYLPNHKTCIEPSSGIGRFAENRPEKFTLFEWEKESSRIAKILHPEADVVQGAFEANFIGDGRFNQKHFEKFDCAVGNPPYGKMTGTYKKTEGKNYQRYDDYFISRTLDTMKDNGVMVMVLPHGFLNNSKSKAKEIIASKGKILEAWRLPEGTFDSTKQGTDIVVIRKEPGDINDFIGGNYFKNNPSHVCGDIVDGLNQWGEPIKRVVPHNGDTFESAIESVDLHDIEAVIKELPKAETVIKETESEKKKNRSEGMKGNQNAKGKHNFVASTGVNMTAEEFNKKYGIVTSKQELDVWKFTDYNGNIDMSKITDEQKKFIETSKSYVKDGNNYINVVNYASGNIREKLEELEVEIKGNEITQEDYEYKKSLLNSAMPAEKSITEFTLSPIADWTRKYSTKDGGSLISGFYEWIYNGKVDLNEAELPLDSPVAPEEIPPEISFGDVIDYIDKKNVRGSIKDADNKNDRKKIKYTRAEKRRETAEYLFNKYLREGLAKDDQDELVKRWNDNFNAYKNPDYSKIPFFIDGMNSKMGTYDFTLTPQQLKGISFLTNKGSGLLAYDVGVGKALANSEKVLTPKGWVLNGSLKEGDYVIGDDGKPAQIEHVYPQGVQDIYEVVFSDGAKVRCTKEHLWNVQLPYMRNKAQSAKKKYKTVELQSIMNNLRNKRGDRKYSIPICKPIEYQKKDLFIAPYLMGILLGDGTIKANSVSVTSADDFILNKIKSMLQGCSLHYGGQYDYRITLENFDTNKNILNPIVQGIKTYGLENHKSDNKFIPSDYLFSSVDDRIELLRGLLDTDGYVKKDGTTTIFYTISKQLAEDVRQLVMSLGGTVSISGKQGKYKKDGKEIICQYCYVIVIKLTGFNPFSLPRKADLYVEKTKYKPVRFIDSVKFVGREEASCIWVNNESHLYITNDYVVTHNTVTGLCATVNQLQTGKAKKPLIVVPNAVYENWIAEIYQHFPDIKLNELHNLSNVSKDWKPADGTLSICTYEALEKLTFTEKAMEEIHSDVEFAQLQKTKEDDKPKSARKQALESEKINETVGSMTKTSGTGTFNFDELGFDHLTVDEIHNFKNIFYVPRNVEIKNEDGTKTTESNEFSGISGGKSDRGEKLFALAQYVQRHNDNRNMFGLSATPFQNSPIEIYNILSLFARQRMKDLGIYSLEEFVKQFAQLKSEYVVTAHSVEERKVMKNFNNLTALQNLITEYIDKVDGDEANIIRPQKRVHLPKLEMTDIQRQIMDAEQAYILDQAEKPSDERDPGAVLASMNAMRMATLSPALVNEGRFELYKELGFDIQRPKGADVVTSSPKLQFVCDSVTQAYKKAPDQGQVIYLPRGVNNYDDVLNYLEKQGIPRDAVALLPGGSSEKELQYKENKIHEFNDVNGKCKIIIGGENIKEGVNLNGNSTTLYNCMLGWNPTETQQVEGRIWRQGNKQGITHIVYPLLNDSIDSMLYQKYEEKSARINNIFSYKGNSMDLEEINAEELKFDLIKDPEKRADFHARQDKETAESKARLYGQMIDVLARQANLAFNPLSDNKVYAKIENQLKQEQVLVDKFKAGLKQWQAKAKEGNAQAEKQVASLTDYLNKMKAQMDGEKKDLKRMENTQKSMQNALAKRGIKSMDDANKKRSEYATLRGDWTHEAEVAEEKRQEYLAEAIKERESQLKEVPTLEETVNQYVSEIQNDLHPMDEEWKAKIKAENDKKNGIRKALFFIMGDKFMIRA